MTSQRSEARPVMPTFRTHEEAPGRLFPPLTWDNGWSLSLQADAAGYACTPRACLETLEAYEAVEGVIYGPFAQCVDPTMIGLPLRVEAKFTLLEDGFSPSIGQNLNRSDIEAITACLILAGMSPNAGVPRGIIGWVGRDIWHGTSKDAAEDILTHGIDMAASHLGYFGEAFYVADDRALAASNYAEFSDEDGPGSVLAMTIREGANILDLRNMRDFAAWNASGLPGRIGARGFARSARQAGIDGVYDRSVGGLAIYNPTILEGIRLDPADLSAEKDQQPEP